MIQALTSQLTNDDPAVRRAAVEQLRAYEADRWAMPMVVQMLLDNSSGVRDAAAQTLRGWRSARAAGTIVPLIAHRHSVVRNLAGELLVSMGSLAVEPLLPYCHVRDEETQKFAIDLLGAIGDPEAAVHLFGALESPDDNVVCAAVEAMGGCRVAGSVTALKEIYECRPLLRYVVIESLGRIGGAESLQFLLAHVEDEDPLVRFAVLEALGSVGDETAAPLLADIVRRQEEPTLKRRALQSLVQLVGRTGVIGTFPKEFEPQLIATVEADRGREHAWAVEALMWFRGEAAANALGLALGASPALDARLAAYFGSEPDRAFEAALMNLARNDDPPPIVLELVHRALSQFNSKMYNNLLLTVSYEDFERLAGYVERQWNNPDPEMRRFVLDNLFKVDGARAMEHLEEMANDTEPWNRMHAIELVEAIDDPRIPSLLGTLACDGDELVRGMAVAQLQRRRTGSVPPPSGRSYASEPDLGGGRDA